MKTGCASMIDCRGSSGLGVEIQKFLVREPKFAVHDVDAWSERGPAGGEADREDQLTAVLDYVLQRVETVGGRGAIATTPASLRCALFGAARHGLECTPPARNRSNMPPLANAATSALRLPRTEAAAEGW